MIILGCVVQPAFAAGLSTTFGEIVVENLPLGETYSLAEKVKMPLVVSNTGNAAVNLKIEVLAAKESELKEGFAPIPDIGWIELKQKEFTLGPGESAKTDVLISVPDDTQYRGRKFQVYLLSYTTGSTVGVGLKSRFLFSIAQ